MDRATQDLCAVLRQRDKLRKALAANDRQLTAALHAWSRRKPGSRGGVATEAGARFMLQQAGVL